MKSSSYYQYLLVFLLPTHALGWSSFLSSASRITRVTTYRGCSRASATAICVQTNDHDDATTTTNNNTVELLLLLSRSDAIRSMITKSVIVMGGAATVVVAGRGSVMANAAAMDGSTTNKQKSISMTALAALRILQRTQTQLSIKLFPFIEQNDYVGVKGALRQPPFDTLRKNASILVENEISATTYQQLQQQYKVVIGALEKIDTTSSLGMRGGRSVPATLQLQEDYETFTRAFDNFLTVSSTSYPPAPAPPLPATGTTTATAITTTATTTNENNNCSGSTIDSTSSTTTTLEE